MIEGVKLYPLKRISVPKGDIYHALKKSDEGFSGFGEAYFSEILGGEIKGWKRHNKYPLNIIVIKGKIGFVIYDDREGSPTYGEFKRIVLSPEDNYQRLYVSPGLWMAFYGVENGSSILLDIIPEAHDPEEASKKELSEIEYNFFE